MTITFESNEQLDNHSFKGRYKFVLIHTVK